MSSLVSIIVVNWNGGRVFENYLKSLSKIDYPNWELIVVDNGSEDESNELTKLIKGTKLIQNKKNLGFARANNQGYKRAKGKYILLLNNDTRVTRTFLTKLVSRIEEDETIGVIQPKIRMMDKPKYLDNAGSFWTWIGFLHHRGFGRRDSKEFSKEREIFSAKGAAMLVRREVIEKVGLFDRDFVSYFEESDFCWRTWLAGWRVLFYPRAVIYHKVGFTISRLDIGDINYHYYKNRINSLIKNLGARQLAITFPVHIAISKGIAFVFLVRGRPKNGLMIIKALWWNFINLKKTLRKRRRVQGLRRVSDREIFTRLGRPADFLQFYRDFKRVERDIG